MTYEAHLICASYIIKFYYSILKLIGKEKQLEEKP